MVDPDAGWSLGARLGGQRGSGSASLALRLARRPHETWAGSHPNRALSGFHESRLGDQHGGGRLLHDVDGAAGPQQAEQSDSERAHVRSTPHARKPSLAARRNHSDRRWTTAPNFALVRSPPRPGPPRPVKALPPPPLAGWHFFGAAPQKRFGFVFALGCPERVATLATAPRILRPVSPGSRAASLSRIVICSRQGRVRWFQRPRQAAVAFP
jgi:hypothetical protein